ncbi:hypothetical protein Trydic_g9863 [Trypoxylus dichotomus]
MLLPIIVAFPIPWTNTEYILEQVSSPLVHNTLQVDLPIGNFTDHILWNATTFVNDTISEKEQFTKNNEELVEMVEETTLTLSANVTERAQTANQEEEEDDDESEEENTDLVQSLISSFLSGLSTPEGGVDVEAIVGLIGGLSVPNDDGTYDFSGLTETIQSVLGPNAEGGGSDFGAFLGGLLGAFIQGVANPPGAKGAGKLTGRLIASFLPELSAAAPSPEEANHKREQSLDATGFFHGFIKGSSAGNMRSAIYSAASATISIACCMSFIKTENDKLGLLTNIKQTIFKATFSFISSLFTKPKRDW